MYIMNAMRSNILNSDFVERFLVVDKPDASLVIASYSSEREPVTMGKYKDKKEARDCLDELFAALGGGQAYFTMPDSTIFYEQRQIEDKRTKRKGGS